MNLYVQDYYTNMQIGSRIEQLLHRINRALGRGDKDKYTRKA